ncbi:hypothetical protein LEMLEM_LOCUS7077 [Lemmus lemmus]
MDLTQGNSTPCSSPTQMLPAGRNPNSGQGTMFWWST